MAAKSVYSAGLSRHDSCSTVKRMQHRHLNHERFSLAAIDDVMARGKIGDWFGLRQPSLADPEGAER